MKALSLRDNTRALVVVAHPDDEVIWMGGVILLNPKLRWTVFSLCRESDRDRKPKFRRVSKLLGARGIITDLDDESKLSFEESILEAKKLIKKRINFEIDILFTHDRKGDYGHIRHKTVNRAINELLKEKYLKPKAVFYFNYKKISGNERPLMAAKKDSDYLLDLPAAIFERKKKIVAEIYGYPYDGIDVGLCPNPEGFSYRLIK